MRRPARPGVEATGRRAARNNQPATTSHPPPSQAHHIGELSDRLGDDDLGGLRVEALDASEPRMSVRDPEFPAGGALEVMATLTGLDEHDLGCGPRDRERQAREARPGPQIDDASRRTADQLVDGGPQRERVGDQPVEDAIGIPEAAQVDAGPPVDDQLGESRKALDLLSGEGGRDPAEPLQEALAQWRTARAGPVDVA